MEVETRYKETEVGKIPLDWSVDAIEDIATVIRGASPRPKGDPRYYGGNVPRLMVEDVTRDGKYVTPQVDFLTEAGAKRSRPCEKGTLTIVCSGKVGVPSFLAVDACIHDGFLALVNIKERVHDDFLYHLLESQRVRFDSSATHGGVFTNLTTAILRRFKIPVPPLPEQRAIADTLSDVDALISKLDALIAKKRAIKTATMQALLTGEQRLPGFGEPWTTINMADASTLNARIGWHGLTTDEYREVGNYHLVTGTDFDNGRIDWSKCHYVDEDRYSQDRNIQLSEGDVLLTKDGTIGKVGYVESMPGPATLNSGVFVIRPKNKAYIPLFLYYILKSSIFVDFLNKLKAGSTVAHLYQKDFKDFTFKAPDKDEQRAIVKILSDMDAEIEALRARREKTRAIKQGMMQELLTGRTRLV